MIRMPWQAKREDLEKQVIRLSRMVEEMSTEHAQLQAERDRLGEYVQNLQTQQQQPRCASVADLKAQVGPCPQNASAA